MGNDLLFITCHLNQVQDFDFDSEKYGEFGWHTKKAIAVAVQRLRYIQKHLVRNHRSIRQFNAMFPKEKYKWVESVVDILPQPPDPDGQPSGKRKGGLFRSRSSESPAQPKRALSNPIEIPASAERDLPRNGTGKAKPKPKTRTSKSISEPTTASGRRDKKKKKRKKGGKAPAGGTPLIANADPANPADPAR